MQLDDALVYLTRGDSKPLKQYYFILYVLYSLEMCLYPLPHFIFTTTLSGAQSRITIIILQRNWVQRKDV